MNTVPMLDAAAVARCLSFTDAVGALEGALRAGFDPAADLQRSSVPLSTGEFLLMPSETPRSAGVKLLTVAPDNPRAGLPRIQGFFILFDGRTLSPAAILDGAALTTIRTPAVSLAATRRALLRASTPLRIVVYGTGPQARAHVAAIAEVLAGRRDIASVSYVVRSPATDVPAGCEALPTRSDAADAALRAADVIVCATTSRVPLFASDRVRDDAVVVAVGSHEPDARELDSALMGRAQIVVEDVTTALREAGDVVLAVRDGSLSPADLIPMADVVTGAVELHHEAPVVFKSTGMSWEDLVVAQAAFADAPALARRDL